MINFINKIALSIAQVIDMNVNEIESFIEIPKDKNNGDYAFPCFRLAKQLKKAPPIIAEEIKQKIQIDEQYISKVEIVGGYLNFYINKHLQVEELLKHLQKMKNMENLNLEKEKIL